MLLNPLTFHAPGSTIEAARLLTTLESTKLMAGGTFVLNTLKTLKKKGAKTPSHIINLKRIPELKGITLTNNELIINSMTTIDEIFEYPSLKDNFCVLKKVCRNISTQPIRNMATIGGNLTCRYTWTEMPAVMVGLDAQFCFIDSAGKQEIISPESFFKNGAKTDKILEKVIIKHDPTASIAYRRVAKSSGVDIPLLSLIIKTNFKNNKFTNTRVAINNCVAFAQRDYILEEFLNSSYIIEKTAHEALDHLDTKIYDTRSTEYKSHMFRISIKNAILELVKNKK